MKIRITGKLKRAAVGIYNTVTPADQQMNRNFAADNAAEIAAQNQPKTEAEKLAASGIGPNQQTGAALNMNTGTTVAPPMTKFQKFLSTTDQRLDNVMDQTFGNPWSLYNMAGFASNIVEGINNRRDMKRAERKERDFYSTTGGLFAEADPDITSRGIRAVSGTMRNRDFPNQIGGNTSFQGMMQKYYNPFRAELGLSVDNVYAPGAALSEFTPALPVEPVTPSISTGAGPVAPPAKDPLTFDSGFESAGNLREFIGQKESGGNYGALPKDKNGHLVSSAVGKYQFLWNSHKDWISKVTGVASKDEFRSNPQAQEKAFDYWDQTVLTPKAVEIQRKYGINAPIENIKYMIHFAGPAGAEKYFATGKETVDGFGMSTTKLWNRMEEGGSTDNNPTMKIRITGTPDMQHMAYGGQSNYGLDLGQRKTYGQMQQPATDSISNVMTEKDPSELADDEQYVVMAEDKETVVSDMDGDGGLEFKQISGDPHSAASGGTKITNKQLNANPEKNGEGAFIFSQKLKIKDQEALKKFGINKNKASFAEASKLFDTTKEKKVLDNPNADFLDKHTADLGKRFKEEKLQALADYQEAIKGNPQGRPNLNKSLATAAFGGYFPMADEGVQMPDPPAGYRKRTSYLDPEREMADFQSVEDLTNFYKRRGYSGGANIGEWQKWMVQQAKADPFYRQKLTGYLRSVPLTNKGRNLYGQDADKSKLTEEQLFEQFQDGLWDFRAPRISKPETVTRIERDNKPVIPGLNFKMEAKPIPIIPTTSTTGIPPAKKPTDPYLPYNGIQMANTLYAASRPVKGYFDRPFVPEYVGTQAVFDEPNYDPLLSANATRMDFMNQLGNAQAARASGSYNPELIQGIVGETDRARRNNLNIANQTLSQNNMMYNQNNMLRAREMDNVRENNIRTREQMDIAKDLKYNNTMKNFGKMVNDRITMQKYNLMYPQFAVTGRLWDKMPFAKGRPLGTAAPTTTGSALPSMQDWLKSRPGMAKTYQQANPEKQMEIEKAYDAYLRTQQSMLMRSGSNVGANMMNPYMMGMFDGN